MDRDKLIQRLRATFLVELREHVEAFNRELLALERESSDQVRAESIKTLFRTAHSLKGAARAVSAGKLEAVCHKLEELLSGLRDGTRPLTPEVFESLFAAVDTFEETGRAFGGGEETKAPAAAPPPVAARPEPPTPAASRSTPQPAPAPAPAPEPAPLARAPETPRTVELPNLPAVQLHGAEAEPPANALQADVMVRVPERKLDSLLAGSGELLIARRRLDVRAAELSELRERLAELRTSLAHAERTPRQRLQTRPNGAGNGNGGLQEIAFAAPSGAGNTARDASRAKLAQLERALDAYSAGLAEDTRSLERAAQALDERIHQLRMLRFSQACDALHRTVRDLSARDKKPIELEIEGGEIELDRSLIDGLRAPLLHLVRNAVDHGIESAEERSLAGKPARARLSISAAIRGETVEVDVRDDGRGIDLDAIRKTLREQGQSTSRDDQDTLRSIFEAGFSTARTVTDVSGRGVGLDVVRSQIEGMRGSVGVRFQPGAGSCFTLSLPLTVTTLRALLLRAGPELFALPSSSIASLLRVSASELSIVQGRETLMANGAPLPLVSLAEVLGVEAGAPAPASKRPILILALQNQRVALAVEELIAEQDVVIKPLGRRIQRVRHVSGATILPSGRVALLLHAADLLRSAQDRVPARRSSAALEPAATPARKRVLLVDDSATTRTLEKSILEAAGYEVSSAADGGQAWQLLQEHGADLVVSDVEMPNMNGFVLTQTIRSSKRFRDVPVILLTSLDSEQDRSRGMECGADAYLVKSAFDQGNLLETIRQLL